MRKLMTILCVLLSFMAQAQNADEFINSVIEKNKSYDDISITFDSYYQNKDTGVKEKSNGLASMKGNSYYLNMNGQEMICDGKTLWTHLIDDEEVMISEATEDNSSPFVIINSFTENAKATFVKNDNPEMTIVEITGDDTFEKATISIDKELKIKKIHIFISTGDEFIYDITSFKTNQNLPDSMFIFDKTSHPNVEIIDMR